MRQHENRSAPQQDIEEFRRKNQYFDEPSMSSDAVPVKPQRLMSEISRLLPRNTVYFADIGNTVTWAERYLPCYPEGRFIALTGLSAMGSATAACIGGKLGRPGDPVLCLCGDGDFHMTGMEVSTAVNHRIPVVWVVLKNGRLAMIHDVQGASYQSRYIAADLGNTDFVGLARALGAQGFRGESPTETATALQKALDCGGPAVVEVTIDNQKVPPMKSRMLALRRSMGLPEVSKSISWKAIKALWQMVKER